MIKGWHWLFGPIRTQQDAIQTLSELRKGWFIIAAIQAVLYIYLAWFTSLMDVGVYLIAGYFLPRQKSRTLAWGMLFFSIFVFLLTIASRFGAYEGGKNIVLALLVIGLAYRSVKACSFFHHRAQTVWKNVFVVWGTTLLAALVVFVVSFVVIAAVYPDWENMMSDEQVGTLVLIPMILVSLVSFLILPRRFPLTEKFSTVSTAQ
jgi:hypothetical protein